LINHLIALDWDHFGYHVPDTKFLIAFVKIGQKMNEGNKERGEKLARVESTIKLV